MSGVPLVPPRFQFSDANGVPLAGGFVYTYLAGTSTLTSTWQDYAQASLNTNPITLSAAGSCTIFGDPAKRYKLVIQDSAGVEQTHLGGDNTMLAGAFSEQVQHFSWPGAWTLTGAVFSVTKVMFNGRYIRPAEYTVVGNVVTYTGPAQRGITHVDIFYV